MNIPAFFRRLVDPPEEIAHRLYGCLVAQARSPAFYTDYEVPDTEEGRYGMIVLHTCLLFRRLNKNDQEKQLAQDVFDYMLKTMDQGLREAGIGRWTVPKRVKKLTQLFYGCAEAYDKALNADDRTGLGAALARNIWRTPEPPAGAAALAAYTFQADREMASTAFSSFVSVNVAFPDPHSFAPSQPLQDRPTP